MSLTFDDARLTQVDCGLPILDRFDVKATFFMVGEKMMLYPDIVKEVVKGGHSIGYHSYNHRSLKSLTIKEFIVDIQLSLQIEEKLGVSFSNLYRPAYGDLTSLSLGWLMWNRWKIVLWSLDTNDSYLSEEEIISTFSQKVVTPGEIILMHDDYEKTIKILPKIIHALRNESLELGAI